MDKKVIYGEYTLQHWIELIMRKNVVLPKYQRHFVWKEEHFNKFIAALKGGNFIPPVIIGAFDGENIILDGQQRLTSVLLAYLGYFPKHDEFKTSDLSRYVDASDDEIGEENDEPIEWTLNLITDDSSCRTRDGFLRCSSLSKYQRLDVKYQLEDTLLNSIYLGFSYIVPEEPDPVKQQKFYSTVFRDINQQRVAMLGQESRRSLYYLDRDLEGFFNPEICQKLKLKQNSKIVQYDFVRALAFLCQYAHDGNETYVAKKCRRQEQLEVYYENFINDVVLDADSPVFGQFSTYMGKREIESRSNLLKTAVEALSFTPICPTILEADVNYMGLIYYVFLKGRSLNTTTLPELKAQLAAKIEEYKGGPHSDSPNRVTYIRRRIKDSIDIYSRYLL